jgi:hypothetical protein
MFTTRRTEIQIALLLVGISVWGYGTRADIDVLKYIGIVLFAAATLLRLFKPRDKSEISE